MRVLLYIAAAASAQTRITNWEEQHQRFVRQAAFEDLLSWFRATSASRGLAPRQRDVRRPPRVVRTVVCTRRVQEQPDVDAGPLPRFM